MHRAKVELIEDALASAIKEVELDDDACIRNWDALRRELHIGSLQARLDLTLLQNEQQQDRSNHDVVLGILVSTALEHL